MRDNLKRIIRKILAVGIGVVGSFFCFFSMFEFIRLIEVKMLDDPRIKEYPFGSEHAGFFFRTLWHYKGGLLIDICLWGLVVWGTIRLWGNRRGAWFYFLPAIFFVLYTVITIFFYVTYW